MKVIILGGAGFIGTNLIIQLAPQKDISITAVDNKLLYFRASEFQNFSNIHLVESDFTDSTDFDSLVAGHEIVYHLVSTTVPATSNLHISEELQANVITTSKMLEACVRQKVKKVIFISSGGTVYGKECSCPLNENVPTNPINSYGIQKVTIEKLLYLYHYVYGLDYRVVRLSNPYGPYQRPNGVLGAVTTFTYKALRRDEITVYGDGSIVRDFIYIDDAVRGIINISLSESKYRTFNLGCGYGTSIKEVLETIKKVLDCDINIVYMDARKVDVPINYLDITRYEESFGKLAPIGLQDGIKKTAEFLKKEIGT